MKKRLFRAVSLLFVLASIINLTAFNPVGADAASDKQAVKLIGECKSILGPFAPGTDCATYVDCLAAGTGTVCDSVRALNAGVPAGAADLQKCVSSGKAQADCANAWQACMYSHLANNAVSSADAKTCSDAISKGDLATANPTAAQQGKTDCAIQGIGWIVCPVVRFLSIIVDAAYGFVESLLTVQPLYTGTGNSTSKGVFDAWSMMRNYANVAFVIVFLFIIFSQVTSIGISNYGIKRMLPRLIISAILVNVSYWICAAAVDISNILGTSMKGVFDSLQASLTLPNATAFNGANGSGWQAITGAVLAGTVGTTVLIYIGLSALLPMLLAALLAIVTVFLVLTLRQALIILLIVVSPLAFVAYLLPNTENWFKRWRETLQSLLLMYPIIAIIFGASALASKVVMGTASGQYAIAIATMGAGISVIPLAITPIVMKASNGLLNRFGGIVNNPNRGPFDRMRKGAEGYRKNRQEYRQLKDLTGTRLNTLPGRGISARQKARREAVLNNRKAELNRAKTGYIADLAASNEGFRGTLAQGGAQGAEERALAQAINVQAKLKADEVTAATAIIKNANLEGDKDALQRLALGGEVKYKDTSGEERTISAPAGSALQTAAIQQQFKIGDIPSTDELVMNSGSMGVDQRQAIAEGMKSLSSKVRYYSGGSSNAVAQGAVNSEADLNDLVTKSINDGKYGVNELLNADHDALTRVADVAADPSSGVKADQKAALQAAAEEIRTNDSIKKPAQRVQSRLDKIESGDAYTTPPPTP